MPPAIEQALEEPPREGGIRPLILTAFSFYNSLENVSTTAGEKKGLPCVATHVSVLYMQAGRWATVYAIFWSLSPVGGGAASSSPPLPPPPHSSMNEEDREGIFQQASLRRGRPQNEADFFPTIYCILHRARPRLIGKNHLRSPLLSFPPLTHVALHSVKRNKSGRRRPGSPSLAPGPYLTAATGKEDRSCYYYLFFRGSSDKSAHFMQGGGKRARAISTLGTEPTQS